MVDDGWSVLHGGIKIYGGNAAAARHYVESDHSRADDYYLAQGSGLAERYAAVKPSLTAPLGAGPPDAPGTRPVRHVGSLDGDAYESWVAGYDPDTGLAKGRISDNESAVRFVEVTVNGPKTWSLAAAVHPEVAQAYDAAQERAARQIIGWVAEHGTTRVGPLGRQVQVSLERVEAATVRHYTSRAGDPHRHLHLQINAKVWAAGKWRAIHTVGVRDSLDAINGIGHAAVLCDPQFRTVLAEHGYSVDPATGEIDQLVAYVPRYSQRAAQINRNRDRYEAQWRAEHPGEEPGPRLRQGFDTRAWSTARPDKGAPRDGQELCRSWVTLLHELGFTPPQPPSPAAVVAATGGVRVGELDRDQIAYAAMGRLGTRRSAWNPADIRGEIEQAIAATGLVAATPVRDELAEDLVERVLAHCEALLPGNDVPEHIRVLTSPRVLNCEADLARSFTRRATADGNNGSGPIRTGLSTTEGLDVSQRDVAAAIAGSSRLVVIEGAAGAGKTTTLAAARAAVEAQGSRMMVVTPTRKAAQVAAREVETTAETVHWLTTQHGFRQDPDGRWGRVPPEYRRTAQPAWLMRGDVLVVDEAGMLTQDAAQALSTIADEAGAHLVLLGDRHQLPAVGRGGVLDLAARHCHPDSHLTLDTVHRFTDPDYADLSLQMRTGERPGEVFDALLTRGQITIYPTEVERTHTIAGLLADPAHQTAHQNAHQQAKHPPRPLVIAHTNQEVTEINNAVRDLRTLTGELTDRRAFTTKDGQNIGVGDVVATRLNDRDLRVANRDAWTITAITRAGRVQLQSRTDQTGRAGPGGRREVPGDYATEHLELAYATTANGAQGETVEAAHMIIDDRTSAASAYVGMTRGRRHNTAHLVAETVDDARSQWIDTFSRDRADLGPAHAGDVAAEDVARFGTTALQRAALRPRPADPGETWPRTRMDLGPSRRPRPPEPLPIRPRPAQGPPR